MRYKKKKKHTHSVDLWNLIQAFSIKKYQSFLYTEDIHSSSLQPSIYILMMRSTLILQAAIIYLITICSVSQPESKVNLINLNQDWEVQVLSCPREGKKLQGQKLATTIPTTIHLDLLRHKKIQDPFFGSNYLNLKWISGCHVKYSKKFSVRQQDLSRTSELIFHGIDTYSKVTLNGEQILRTNNSFVTYTKKIKKLLKQQNTLEVIIESADKYDSQGQSKNGMPFKYAHTRKACYQYSWDWAPEMVTMGIWKNVQLKIWDQLRIDYVWIRNKIISPESAVLNFATKLESERFKDQPLENYSLKIYNGPQELVTIPVRQQAIYADVNIQNPKFWWPNGIGEPHIYDFIIELWHKDQLIERKTTIFGIRTAELDLSNKQFKVKINGYPIYCKGANYVPLDMLHPRLTNKMFQTSKTYTYEKLFADAVASNFNMIRLWGGGQYEDDEFFQLASRNGIMIFHDFMFSDSIYPSSSQFLHNVELEVKQQIRRVRNYPALALWCGNNQILQGISDWGWGTQNYKKDYKLLFETLIKRIIDIENPSIAYIPSSPIYGVGNYGFQRGGDFHYWSVWAGGAAFQSYQQAVGPFNSQFGTQALPVWQSIKQFTAEQDRNYSSPVLLAHQRHNSQFGTLRNYMSMYMKQSRDFESESYLSGVVQAMAIEIAIRAQRSAKPKSYGTLYWQFNDAWPAISWAAVDYYGRWKPLQYMAKRMYTNIAVFTLTTSVVVAINDNLYPTDVIVKMANVDFEGNIISKDQKIMTLAADSVATVFNINRASLTDKITKVVTVTEIYHKDSLVMRSTRYYKPYKELQLPKATVTCSRGSDEKQLIFSADKVVRNIFIDLPGLKISDNYFDIVSGFPVTVQILEDKNTFDTVKSNAKFISVREATTQGEKLNISFV